MIVSLSKDVVVVKREQDVVLLRNRVKEFAQKKKMGLLNQAKLMPATSELVRNMLKYADGGDISIEVVSKGRENGIRLIFRDDGPGISDVHLAMKDGYFTA